MNKNFINLTIALTYVANVNAQTVTGRFNLGSPDNVALSIPKEFAYDNTPLILLYDNTDFLYDNTIEHNLLIYDENLDLKKTINLIGDKTFDFQLTYQDYTREVLSVDEKGKSAFCEYQSYKEFLNHEMLVEPSFDESQLIIKKQENGDSIIFFDYAYRELNANMYFAYDYFGMKYPKIYFVCSNDKMTGFQTYYTIKYSDWEISDTHVEERHEPLKRLLLCNINLNNGDGKNNCVFEVSQTLFNEDEKFEYLIPKYNLSSEGNVSGGNPDSEYSSDETIVTTQTKIISENRYVTLTGFQVVSENGDIVKDLNFESEFTGSINDGYAFVITIGNNTYLAFDGSSNGKNSTIFYKIDRTTTDIKQIRKAPASMMLRPSITDRKTPINISFGDNNESGSEIVVVSANGTIVKKQAIPSGQTSTQLLVPYGTGIYCISRVQKNRITDVKKIIIK